MTVPQEVRLARHGGDLDQYGHDVHPGPTPMMDEGDLVTFTLTDRALAGTAYADTTFGSQDPDLANDGDDATYHLSLGPVAGRWLAVDLLGIYPITAFRFKQGSASTERADTWRLESSSDYDTWTTRDSGTFIADSGVRLLSETVTARYWRLYPVTGGTDGWALYTLSIYSGEEARIPIGDEDDVLTVVGGAWAAAPGSSAGSGYTAHGAMGSTETFSALTGWHSGTFSANCAATFTGAVAAPPTAQMVLELTSDGSSVMTWPGSVVWGSGSAPTLSTTPGEVDLILFMTRDGGTTWYGFPAGGSGTTITDITDLPTAETDTDLRLAPDGAGGVEWAATPTGRWELAVITGSPPDPLYADGDYLYILVP